MEFDSFLIPVWHQTSESLSAKVVFLILHVILQYLIELVTLSDDFTFLCQERVVVMSTDPVNNSITFFDVYPITFDDVNFFKLFVQ